MSKSKSLPDSHLPNRTSEGMFFSSLCSGVSSLISFFPGSDLFLGMQRSHKVNAF